MARNDRFDDLLAAYSAAWDIRTREGDTSFDVLLAELHRHGVADPFASDGPGRDLMVRIWERDVPPTQFKSAFMRELPRLGLEAVRAIGGAYWTLMRLFAGTKWERVDLSHLDMPPGHKKLSDDRKAFDLALRWFHKPVQEIELPVTLHKDRAEVLSEGYEYPSPNRREAFELPAWLRLENESPGAVVMVGHESVGLTRLPPEAWQDLMTEAANNIFADGRLFLPFDERQRATVQCVIPKRV